MGVSEVGTAWQDEEIKRLKALVKRMASAASNYGSRIYQVGYDLDIAPLLTEDEIRQNSERPSDSAERLAWERDQMVIQVNALAALTDHWEQSGYTTMPIEGVRQAISDITEVVTVDVDRLAAEVNAHRYAVLLGEGWIRIDRVTKGESSTFEYHAVSPAGVLLMVSNFVPAVSPEEG